MEKKRFCRFDVSGLHKPDAESRLTLPKWLLGDDLAASTPEGRAIGKHTIRKLEISNQHQQVVSVVPSR